MRRGNTFFSESTRHTPGVKEEASRQRTQYNRTDWEGRHGNRSLGLHLFIILYVVRVGQANNECILEKVKNFCLWDIMTRLLEAYWV